MYLENRWKMLHMLGKNQAFSILSLFDNDSGMQTRCHFFSLLLIEFRSIRRCSAFPGQIHRLIVNGI